jgi:LysM repeat protein
LHHWYNAGMQKFRLKWALLFLVTALSFSACSRAPDSESPDLTPTLEGSLRPYPSDTPSATPFPTGFTTPTPSPTVTPTPTPVYYDVREGDDMYGIAFFYGISPQMLMTANPTVNPRAMGPGTTLLIPITPGPAATATSAVTQTPTLTQPFAQFGQPNCYPDAAGGLWCFVLVVNAEGGALENVSGVVRLTSGDTIREETAVMSLNFLPEGESLPLVAYFQPPIPDNYSVSAEMDFYLPVMPGDARYLPVEISSQNVDLSEDGQSVQISGALVLGEAEGEASYLWVHATAFDAGGNVVAARRWEAESPIEPGETSDFTLSLYSLGGAIDEVSLLAEAHRRPLTNSTPTP